MSKLMCAHCRTKQEQSQFSSKEKKKLNKRVCTPCVEKNRKEWQKKNKKNILRIIYQQSSNLPTVMKENPTPHELARREKERKKLTSDFNTYIVKRDSAICYYCHEEGKTVDHKHPIARGGATTEENCVCACQFCNNIKGHMLLDEFKNLKNNFTSYEWNKLKTNYLQKNP